MLRIRSAPPGLRFEFLQLGIAGGEKEPYWDSVKKVLFLKLMTKEEAE